MTADPAVADRALGTRPLADPPWADQVSRLSRFFPATIISLYAVLGLAIFWPMLPHISERVFGGGIDSHDYVQSVWFLGWISHALSSGLNPLFSHAIYAPTGVNLAQNTSSPLLALVATPFTLAFGPLVATNLLLIVAMPLSATAAFIVLRKWHVWSPAAALGGLFYGFSPFMLAQSQGHLELIFVPLPPLIALTVVSLLRREGSQLRIGLQLGGLVAAQYLISPEVLAAVAVFVALAIMCVAIRNRRELPRALPPLWLPTTIAVIVTAVLIAYPLSMMFFGPQHFTGPAWPAQNPYHNDIFSFFLAGYSPFDATGRNPLEAGGYIGFPLMILAAVIAWRSRRDARVQLTLVLLASAVLLSLGPYLSVGRRLSDVPLPFLLLDHIPLLYNILPSRMSFEVDAFFAALIAFGLDAAYRPSAERDDSGPSRLSTRQQWWPIAALSLTLGAVIVAIVPSLPSSSPSTTVALPTAIRRAIPPGNPTTITYPYDTLFDMRPMLWEAEDAFKFSLVGGYAYRPDSDQRATLHPGSMEPPGLQAFLVGHDPTPFPYFYGVTPPLNPGLVASSREALAHNHIRLVIVASSLPGGAQAEQLFRDSLGPPMVSKDGFSLWVVPVHLIKAA